MYCMQLPRPISKVIESQILKRIELYCSLNSVYIIHTQNVDTICNHITKPQSINTSIIIIENITQRIILIVKM